jgi:hypothetical protein
MGRVLDYFGVAAIPEPSTATLVGLAILALINQRAMRTP